MGLFFWAGHAVFGNWSGWRELILLLPFAICIFIAFLWFALWPWCERDYLRAEARQTPEPKETTASH